MAEIHQLIGFLHRSVRLPFAWGVHDCLLWPSDWVLEWRGIDPAEEWRGTYSVKFGAARIVYKFGGIVPLADAGMLGHGFRRTTDPQRGDVAVVFTDTGERGAVVLGDFVAMLGIGAGSVVVQRWPVIAAWSV